jgi:carbonic anhydrase
MSQILKEVLEANGAYADSFGDKGKLALPPARRFAILTCMDARIDPAKLAGCRRATLTSFETPVGAPATTRSARS